MGAIAASVAYIIAGHHWGSVPHLPGTKLDEKFDPAAYTGVPWSVQATLVALVYPIVLSFIALMLQRRAHSTVALRVYVLDSAVVPAGASSIGLLLAMGMQYFATPYSTPCFLAEHMASLLVMNGTWFATNVFLTGFFLSRTVRFIQEEEQRHAYTRVAVDVVLRAELTSAMKQHIFVNAPYADWGFKIESVDSDSQPQVRMFRLWDGEPAAQRDLKGSLVLHDVHLHLLKWAVRSWCKRARLQQHGGNRPAPLICFPPMVGQDATGQVVLCSVENGPSLTAFERVLVRAAFFYRPSRQGTLSLSTKKMLEEIGVEVEAAAEQHRFGAAEDGLRNVIRLHKTLLLASAVDSKGAAENAATIGTSPYAWGESSFDIEWLKPYREIGRIAVGHLDQDSRLLRTLAIVPASIAAELPPKPEKLVINAMLVGMNLTNQLGGWWTRKADASLAPGATSFSGMLPAPLSKVYEQALIAFVGSWGHLRIRVSESKNADGAEAWAVLTARALVYAKHIDNSGEMFLKAVSRGDEVASSWLLDSFMKWWGNRQHELEYGDPDEFQVRHVTLSLADKAWPEAQSFLWDGGMPVTVDTAGKALSLAIRRYWESMRLYVALLLIHNAGPNPAPDCRELRFAAALIKGTAQHHGGNADCWPVDDVDAVTTAVLGTVFGVETVASRIDGFAEKLRWDNEAPEVSGWIYGWSGTPTDLESMKRAQATLLVAVAVPRGRRIGENKKLVESWWKDLDKLESVARYCQDLRREVLSNDFNSATPAVMALQTHLGTTGRIRSARFAVARTMRGLRKVALHERVITLRALDVKEYEVRRLAEAIAAHAFDPQHWPSVPGTTVHFVPRLVADQQSVTFKDDKKRYVLGIPQQPDAGLAEHMAEYVRRHALGWSFSKRVADAGVAPANVLSLRNNHQATVAELQVFISTVGALCTALRSAGADPVVLVGQAAPASYLHPYRWGPGSWQCPLPPGVTLRNGDPSKGEPAAAFVNETPVYEFDTPNGDCYVVPSAMVKTLEVGGSGTSSALSIRWTQLNDERLTFVVSWNARFR
ncbi:hypothetical protein [Polaromonas jejuensis]|uniref:G-protein coupled receptors family 3 profile domain-containing protein n=1 Tax=Polaromonas jejuensis TaxID=457502 RepID=A0ABW0Q4S9_9BURK|nr:hypothetical protein [Polaromonas jejuensis]